MKYRWRIKFDSLFEYVGPDYNDKQISDIFTSAQNRVFLRTYNPLGNKYQTGFESNEQRRRALEQLIQSASISGSGITTLIQYTGNTSTGSNIISSLSSMVGLNVGIKISGTGIPNDTIITELTGSNSIKISNNATATNAAVVITSGIGKSASQNGVHPNGVFLDLPDGFLYSIEETVMLNSATSEAMVRPVTHDEYSINIYNPYKKPYEHVVWRMDVSRIVQNYDVDSTETNKRTEIILPPGRSLVSYRTRYLRMPPPIVIDSLNTDNQKHCILDASIHDEIIDEAVAIAQAAVKKEEYQVAINELNRAQ